MINCLKFGFAICAFAILASCSDSIEENIDSMTESTPQQPVSNIRTPEEAMKIAKKAPSMFIQSSNSRGKSTSKTIDISKGVIAFGSERNSRTVSDTLMYAVNYCDNDGFVLVSAVRSTPEILAYTIDGSFSTETNIDNPGFNWFMENTLDYLASEKNLLDEDGTITIKPFIPVWAPIYNEVRDTALIIDIPNRVKVLWGQSGIEGAECPNGLCGCAVTAVSMALTYFKYPVSLTLEYKEDAPVVQLEWDKIANHKQMLPDYQIAQDECEYQTHQTISQLCRELGKRIGARYSTEYLGGTLSTNVGLINGLRKLGFGMAEKKFSPDGIVNDLRDSKSVLLISGKSQYSSESHRWVCDAVKKFNVHITSYESNDLGMTWHKYFEKDENLIYNFYNWGWADGGESLCGYYLGYEMDPSKYSRSRASYYNDATYIKMSW